MIPTMAVAAILVGACATAASAAATDPCPVTVSVTATTPDAAIVTVTAPPTDGCAPPSVVTWVNVLVDGAWRSTTQVRDRVGQIPVSARAGSEVTVIARRTLGTAAGMVVGYEREVVRLGSVLRSAPRPPEGLHVWGATDTALALGWSAPDTEAEVGPLTYSVTVGDRTFDVPDTEAVISGLDPATEYVISVEAHSAGGSSPVAVVAARTEAEDESEDEDEGRLSEAGTDPQKLALTAAVRSGSRNTDGSADLDDDPTTVRQTLSGTWVRDDDVESGERSASVRLAEETSAGVEPTIVVSYESPSIADVSVDEETGRFTATLRRGARSGAVVITVTAPAVVMDGIAYEPMSVSRRFVVEAPDLGAWPTAVDQQVTDAVT